MTKTPSQRPKRGADLSALFNVAAQVLAANQSSLNQADSENQNHGDNMVQTFNMITQSMASQRGSAPSTQLQHASEYLAQNAQSGSGQIYSQGLAQAAQQFQGQKAVTPDGFDPVLTGRWTTIFSTAWLRSSRIIDGWPAGAIRWS